MSGNEERGLKRLDIENKLPTGFNELSREEQREVIKKLQDQDIEIRGEFKRKYMQSKTAEHDLAVGIDAVQRLDQEKKIYSERLKGETGSGNYDVQIRGGDTKFIVPILIVVGVIILGLILIMSM
jgi:hypothetical protein